MQLIYRIDVHVEPEVSTNTVRIIVVNQTNGVFLDQSYNLVDSRASQLLEALPVGTYNVTVNYYGDKTHFEGSSKTQFAVTIDNYPINIQLVNMTYGETQLINITVPAASNPDNLEIKLNDTVLTGYTIANYDVDNVVQSDAATAKSDADVEKISNTSENTNTETTNKLTENSIITNDNNIATSNINKDIEKTIKGDGEGTFTELQQAILDNPSRR